MARSTPPPNVYGDALFAVSRLMHAEEHTERAFRVTMVQIKSMLAAGVAGPMPAYAVGEAFENKVSNFIRVNLVDHPATNDAAGQQLLLLRALITKLGLPDQSVFNVLRSMITKHSKAQQHKAAHFNLNMLAVVAVTGQRAPRS